MNGFPKSNLVLKNAQKVIDTVIELKYQTQLVLSFAINSLFSYRNIYKMNQIARERPPEPFFKEMMKFQNLLWGGDDDLLKFRQIH